MPERVLCLDLATTTGWAYWDAAGAPATNISGSHVIDGPGAPIGRFLSGFRLWINAMIDNGGVQLVVFEAPILTVGRTSVDTARKLMALAGVTEMVCHDRLIPAREVHLQVIKRHWTGRGGATKEEMVARCRAMGYRPRDDNEADAIALRDYTTQMLRAPGVFAGPLFEEKTRR